MTTHTLGELCVGGDWACTDGDLETLGYLAGRLAAYAQEPLRWQLITLAEICRQDPDRAVAAWLVLKQQVLQDGRERKPYAPCSLPDAVRRSCAHGRQGRQELAARNPQCPGT